MFKWENRLSFVQAVLDLILFAEGQK